MYLKANKPIFSTADNEDKLNMEEKAFVDDPANADLFFESPSSEKRRSSDDQSSVV